MLRGLFAFLDNLAAVGIDLNHTIRVWNMAVRAPWLTSWTHWIARRFSGCTKGAISN